MDATINSNLEFNENAGAVLVLLPLSAVRSEMNEEQPIFKVTDRRLFNTDGSPRDVPPEEKPEPRAAEPEVAAALPVDAAPQVSTTGSIAAETQPQSATAAGREFEQAEEGAQAELGEEDIVGAKDPASFVNFIMSIASNAASSLGMMEHPVTHKREVDIELGKHWIDVLGMLQKKTRGNLAPQEQEMLEGLLADLRMQYVSLTSSPPKSARTFSGSDITGGR
jgi:hypothetical protein